MSIPTVTTQLPYTAAALTAQAVFGLSPWELNPTVTTPAGTTPENPAYFATQATAQLVAEIMGGTAILVPPIGSQNQGTWMVLLPNNGLINAGLMAFLFTHGYGLDLIVPQMQQAAAAAGYLETIDLSVATPPPAPPAPTQMVGKQFSFGPPYGNLWAFGPSVVPGSTIGQIIPEQPVQQNSGKAVNVVNGTTLVDPVAGPLVAQVFLDLTNYAGWWVGQPAA